MGQKNHDHFRLSFGLSIFVWLAAMAIGTSAMAEAFEGYIDSTALNVRENPGTNSKIVGILLKYDPVEILDSKKVGATTWYSISASSGYTTGWVSGRFVKRGTPPAVGTPASVDYGAKQTPTLVSGPFQYVGTQACRECHEDSVSDFPTGASLVWEKHFHSSAYQTLKRDYTKEIARRSRGVEDPASNWRCVKCHVTGLGAAPSQLGPGYNEEEGVGCEVCHGPGSGYVEEDHGPDIANREAMGFRVLRNLDERREVCTSCHNAASPTFKGFDLRQFSRRIAHWVDQGDTEYRAEAARESKRRVQAVSHGASDAGNAMAGATATATAAAEVEKAEATRRAAQARTRADAASRAAQDRAEAEAARRAGQAEAARNKASAAADLAVEKAAEAAVDEAAAQAAEKAEMRAARAAAENERKAEAARAAAAKAAKAEVAALAAEQRARAEAESAMRRAAKQEAQIAAAKAKADAEAKAAARVAVAKAADNPLAHFLEDVDDVIVLNTDGVKYAKMKFPHRKHAGNEYLPDGDCQTCHHTQEGMDSPEACNDCHDIDGDAEEEKAKKRYAHSKKRPYPKEDEEEVSCVGCHKSMNAMLKAGEREGDRAPVKCTTCHERNS